MTVGIYKLAFNGTNKCYIGKSGCVEKRFINHKSNMLNGTSAKKLQEAYNLYGLPEVILLEATSFSDLDSKEIDYISKHNSIEDGFNRVPGGSSTGYGEYSSTSKYTQEDYYEVLFYLAETDMSYKEISEITGVTNSVIMHISSLSRHFWLSEYYPELYSKLEYKHSVGTRKAIGNHRELPNIVSPTGHAYTVNNLTKFAKEHGLASGGLSSLFARKIITHKGWHLQDTSIPSCEYIKSPLGEVYEIPYRGLKPFAKKYGLHPGDLRKVLNGNAPHCKGWTLVQQ
jgi:hypothetical protein